MTVTSIIVGTRQAKHIRENIEAPTGAKRAPLIFLLAITAYLIVAWIDAAMIMRVGDKIFPLTVGTVTLIGCVLLLVRMMRQPETDEVFIDLEAGGEEAGAPHSLWMRARVGWAMTLFLTIAGIAFICMLASTLGRNYPPGLLQDFVKLPWPLT